MVDQLQSCVGLPAREVIFAGRDIGPTSVHNVIAALQKEQSQASEQHRNTL